jgi:two-component system sensor histidine kinase KdpD
VVVVVEKPDERGEPTPLRRPTVALMRVLDAAPERLIPYATAFAIVLASAGVAEVLYRVLGITRLSSVFLAGVLVTAVKLGRYPGFFAAVLAFTIYNFYLVEPRFTFEFGSAEEVLTLLVFLATALLTGGLAGRVSEEARRSAARARTLDVLFQATQQFSATDEEAVLRSQLVRQVAMAVKGEALVLDDDRTWSAGGPLEAAAAAWRHKPLSADGAAFGEVRWRAAEADQTAGGEIEPLIEVLVDLGAAAIARSRLASETARAEAVARTEQLRSALLASISHDLRTPLTAMLTSVSTLNQFGPRIDDATRSDLLATIQEEAERLNHYVTNVLHMTRLEAGALEVEVAPVAVAEVLGELMRRLQRVMGSRRFSVAVERDLAAVADPVLLEQAVSNVIENAVRFSPDASTIELRARALGGEVVIEVVDAGPGVPENELQLIFEKFYRSRTSPRRERGTGLGLSISRGLIEAMGGRISAARAIGGGLKVEIVAPRATAIL